MLKFCAKAAFCIKLAVILLLFFSAAGYELLSNTLSYNKKPPEIIKVGFLHSAAHPVDNLTVAHTLVKTHENSPVLFADFFDFGKLAHISGYDVFTNVKKTTFKKLAVSGVENMVRRFSMTYRIADGNVKALIKRFDVRVALNYCFNVLGDNCFNHRGQILKMIVKRIAVNSAVLNDVLYGNFVYRLFLQQLQDRSLDCGFSEI